MKRILIILFLLAIFSSLYSQNISASEDYDLAQELTKMKEDLKNFYLSLDRTNAKSDYLWNYGFLILNDLELWNQGQPVISSFYKWFYIYNSIKNSNITGKTELPSDSMILAFSESVSRNKKPVALAMIFFNGDYLTNEDLQNILKKKAKPVYKSLDIFAGTVLSRKHIGKEVRFVFYPDLFFSNQKEKIRDLYVDFGDFKGFRQIVFDTENYFDVKYDSPGDKNIIFKLITETDTFVSFGKMKVIEDFDIKPDFIGYINDTANFKLFNNSLKNDPVIGNFGHYATYMYIEGDDNELDKPVIFVEGFDIDGTYTLEVLYQLLNSEFNFRSFTKRGYDIYIINLQAPDHTLQNNAKIIKDFIKEVNRNKTGHLEGVLVGISMGGLLSRIALKQLEDEGYDHQIGLYISVDAPHKGANIPIGLQYVAQIFNRIFNRIPELQGYIIDLIEEIFGIDIPQVDLYQMLNSNSARQMLIRHRLYPGGNTDYSRTQRWLKNLGYPQQCRTITSVSGSNRGYTVGIRPRDYIFNVTFLVGRYPIIIRSWYARPNNTVQNVAFFSRGAITKFYPFYIDNKDLSNAPGGRLSFGVGGFDREVISVKYKMNFGFVPALSALDISDDIWNAGNLTFFNEDIPTQNSDYIISHNLTPFDDIYADEFNYYHVAQYDSIINLMIIQEFMYDSLFLQNRIIDKDRDFEATDFIKVGRDVTHLSDIYHTKHINIGDVVIKSGASVNMRAGNAIILKKGFKVEPGAKFHAYIDSDKNKQKTDENFYALPEIYGPYLVSDSATFHIIADDYKTIEWKITGYNYEKTFYGKSVSIKNLKSGQYMISCYVYYSGEKVGTSKVLRVKNNYTKLLENFETNDFNNPEPVVYPNPAQSYIKIKTPSTIKTFDITISGVSGNIILTKNNVHADEEIDISFLPAGTYLLTIKTQNYVYNKKFIKN